MQRMKFSYQETMSTSWVKVPRMISHQDISLRYWGTVKKYILRVVGKFQFFEGQTVINP